MSKKSNTALLVVLLLLITVAGVWIWTSPDASGPEASSTAARTQPDRERVSTNAPEEDREQRARRISQPSWRPPAVFARQGAPTPQIPFPRGENGSRRYHTPQTSDLATNQRSRQPVVLAKSPEDGRFHLLPDEIDLHTRLARRMVFDASALDSIVSGSTSRLLAPSVDGEVLTIEFQSVKTRSAHTHTLFGHVVGEEQSSNVQIVYHDGVLHGTVARYKTGQELEYRILADGHMMVREIDQSTMTAPCGNGRETEAEALLENLSEDGFNIIPEENDGIEGDTAGWRIVDVVVGYDQGARVADGGYAQIEARIISSVDLMTTAFANSLITNTELMLLGTIEDPLYVYPGAVSGSMSSNDELGDLNSFADGALDAVSSFATQLGADLISFVLKQTDGSAGIAYRPGRSSIVSRDYMTATRITFAHELGHNLGCDHSWGDSSQSYHSHYCWRLEPPGLVRVRTIMAYDWDWGAGHRIPYFANPNVSYNGAATGAVNGYNVLGDATADQRYYQGGLGYSGSDSAKFGFNGANPTLGANNSNTINTGGGSAQYGATYASTRATRAAFSVTSPLAGALWERGTTQSILFLGGDMKDLATIQLFKGGILHSTLASGLNPATDRDYAWTLPMGLVPGADYMIRVTLDRNGSVFTADSGVFSVIPTTPRVISQSPPASSPVIGTISQLSITFNQVMNPATFDISGDVVTFTGPGGGNLKPSISGASWSAGNTILTLAFPIQSTPGSYQLVLGSQIQNMNGDFLDQDQDNVTGETPQDRYTANFGIDASQMIWSENFDAVTAPALPDGWASTAGSGSGVWTVVSNSSHTPSQSAFLPGYATTTTTHLQSAAISIPVGATGMQFTFRHSYDLETSYDGGRLELSVNGGAWFGIDDSGSGASFGSGGYSGTISANSGASIAGKNAWTGATTGYIQTVVNLTDNAKFAGNSLRARWLLATDSSLGDTGWNVDTIQLTGIVPSASLSVTPPSDLASTGGIGGPFTPGSLEYTLENTGSQSINWTAAKTVAWLDLSATGGTLAPAATTTVTVSINSGANTLLPGAYDDTVIFATAGGLGNTVRNVNLSVTGPGTLAVTPVGEVSSAGTLGGPFSPASLQYTLTNPGNTPINWTAGKNSDWVNLSATAGTLAAGANTTVTATINSNANALAVGAYSDTVSFTNTTNGNGNTTRDIALAVNPAPATITLGNLSQTYDGTSKTVSVTTNPPGLTHEVTYGGASTAPVNAGTYAVVATITDPNYTGSDAKNLVISKAAQTINFAALDPVYDNAAPFALTATATSNLTVSYASSNAAVATVSGGTVTVIGAGTTTITASQQGNANYNAAISVPQTLTVVRFNPLAVTGGPYSVLVGQSVTLNGGASEPSYGQTITAWDWDLNNDNSFGDVTGATPTAISYSDLTGTWGRVSGANTIQLKVTDSSGKTSIATTTLTLITTLAWDANGTGANRTDGAGTWLNPNQWWDGAQNITWISGSNATIGNGGVGGAITAGAVSAGTMQLNNFTGTYTLQGTGTAITQSGGITIGASAGNVTFRGTGGSPNNFTVSGTGGITMNSPGLLTMRENLVTSYTGPTVINNGTVMVFGNKAAGNFTLNGGILTDYYRVTYEFTDGLGTGNNQIQIQGSSGFGGGNQTSIWRIGASGSNLVWGALGENGNANATGFFNPTTLRLRSAQGDNNGGSSIWGWVTLDNRLDLNGATRTIDVYQGGGSIMQSRATIDDGITGSGSSSSLVKNGGGVLFIGGSSSNWGGGTTVNGGILDFGSTSIAGIGGGSGRNISVAAGAGVKFNTLSNAILNRIVETSGEIIVMTGTTSNALDFSSSTGANLPNVWLGNWASNGAKAEISGSITFGGSNYQLGARESSGLLAIVGTNKLTGTRGLVVGGTGASSIRMMLAGANDFSGDTVINTGAKLTLGNNLALQNSALDVGAAGGNFALNSAGTVTNASVAASPTFGGLKGSRNLLTVFTNTGGNNESNLAATSVTGFALNVGTGKTCVYSGAIADFAPATTLTKTGPGTQTFSGGNTYTGATNVSEGKLFINGSLSNTASALNVNAGATLGGTGTIGRDITIAAGGKLEFNISTAAASHDRLDISSGRSFAFSGASVLTITSSSGISPGTYTLITGGNNITGAAPATVNMPAGWAATATISGNSLLLNVAGSLDHFAISPISSPQTIGTAITGITITARDAADLTVTGFSGTVIFGGTAGITGTSANFVAGVLGGVSVTPTVAGGNLTFTVNDGSGHAGSATFTVQTAYEGWAGASGLTGGNALPGDNPDGDSLTNYQEFAFGTNPAVNTSGPITYVPGGDVTHPGFPAVVNFGTGASADFRAVFGRRKNHQIAGLNYIVQFSAGLDTWVNTSDVPTVLTGANSFGEIEAVSVPFPPLIPVEGDFRKPTFFRVGVSGN